MNRYLLVVVVVLGSAPSFAQWKYPPTKTVDATDTYFGKTVKDPWRWLETLKDPEVEAWFKAQAKLTDDTLASLPGRELLVKEWTALDRLKPASYANVAVEHGRVFYKKTLAAENVGKLYFREGWNGAEVLLFDPDTYKPGVATTIGAFAPSFDGRKVVLALTSGGAEYSELRVLEVDKKALLPDSIFPSWAGSATWAKDSASFFYLATNTADLKSLEIELNTKARLHVLGTDVATDRDLLSNVSHPELGIAPREFPSIAIDENSPDLLQATVATVQTEMRAYTASAADLKKKTVAWKPLARLEDKLVRSMAIDRDDVYAITYVDAPRYRVVRTSLKKPDWAHATTVVPEAADSLQYFARSKHFLFLVYSNGIVGRLVKLDLATKKTTEVPVPAPGSVELPWCDPNGDHCLLMLSTWTAPTALYDLDGAKGTLTKSVFDSAVTYPGFDALVSEEVEVPGHDGTMVPLSIIHRKDLKLDGSSPAIIEGYGAYGISLTPWFNPRDCATVLHGVVFAIAHPRGGSEKGEAWYRAGFKTTKPNTWKDFISSAEYLVKKGYTSPGKLGGTGTSAGGILISRALTERPDLFAAGVVNVGIANALRVENSPNGPGNIPEFGTVAIEAEAAALYEMDGVQHVVKGTKYPAVLGVGGWNDPRVSPWQPGKFVAAVQSASTSGKPAMLKINYDDGHFTEEKSVTFANFAGMYAFLLWQSGHPEFQPRPTAAAAVPDAGRK